MKLDVTSREDLEQLMELFYAKAISDPTIGTFFTDVAKINLKSHLPIIVDFWELTLFNRGSYSNNAMQTHIDLHRKKKLELPHFERWLALFFETLDDLFEGPNTELTKTRATSIATVIQIKTQQTK